MGKREKPSGETGKTMIKNTVMGGIIALAVTLIILLICALGIVNGLLKETLMKQCAIAAGLIGALSGGLFAVRKTGGKTLFVGLGVGAIQCLLTLLTGIAFYPEISIQKGIGVLAACLIGGLIAGLIGGKGKRKRKH